MAAADSGARLGTHVTTLTHTTHTAIVTAADSDDRFGTHVTTLTHTVNVTAINNISQVAVTSMNYSSFITHYPSVDM